MRMRATSTCRPLARISGRVVICPWPIACAPVRSTAVPSALEAQVGDFVQRAAARDFKEAAQADAAQATGGFGCLAARGKPFQSASRSALSSTASNSPLS